MQASYCISDQSRKGFGRKRNMTLTLHCTTWEVSRIYHATPGTCVHFHLKKPIVNLLPVSLTSSPSGGGFATPTSLSNQSFVGGVGGGVPHHSLAAGHASSATAAAAFECDIPSSDSMAGGLGSIAGKGDFDRRKKKKWVHGSPLKILKHLLSQNYDA